jgi:hypothetical protein
MYKSRVASFFLSYDIKENELELAKEYTGFNYYLPKGFFIDIVNFLAHHSYGNDNVFYKDDEVSNFLKSIPEFIWEQTKKEYNLLNKALYILKYCGGIIDLKMLDDNEFCNITDKDANFLNKAKFDFELPANIKDNSEISIDILNTLRELFSKSIESQQIKESCIGYKKITNIKKSLLVREDFGYQLTQQISNKDLESSSSKDIIIFVEDTSSSMSKGKSKIVADTVKFFLCQMKEEIHYFTKSYDSINFIKLKTKKEKTDFFSTIKFKRDFYEYNVILNHIDKLYHNQKIIILNDGEDFIPKIIVGNKVYVLNTKGEKKFINDLCKINNGKQICL